MFHIFYLKRIWRNFSLWPLPPSLRQNDEWPRLSLQDLLGILVKLSSGSIVAFKTLYELDISNTLKDILSVYNLSHGMSSCAVVDGQRNQVLVY